jgi:biopolymer transport protein ExbD
MAINTASSSGPFAVINITPMIDVLLVLLIIFMSIAPQKAVGLDALMPHPGSTAEAERSPVPIVLEIGGDGSYRLNTASVEGDALASRLAAVYALRSDRVLFVKAAPDLEFRTVAAAIDIARGAAVDRIALMPR